MFGWGTSSALEEQRTGFWVRGGGFILDSECTSRVIKLDSKQKNLLTPVTATGQTRKEVHPHSVTLGLVLVFHSFESPAR
jgi:hypothetical protein